MVVWKRHIPVVYSTGPKAEKPRELGVARLRFRASATILWRRFRFYPGTVYSTGNLIPDFKEHILKPFTRWVSLDKENYSAIPLPAKDGSFLVED